MPTSTSILAIALAGLLGCSRTSVEGEPDHAPASDSSTRPSADERPTMQTHTIEQLGTGFMRERNDGARVFPLPDEPTWASFVEDMRNAEMVDLGAALAEPPRFTDDRVLLFVEFPDGAGSELRPVVDELAREGASLIVRGHWRADPKGSATDDVTRQWVLIRAPKAALEGKPGISVDVASEIEHP
ncbi:hypothetical protein ACNOYE_01045 [Nannocystaceae bacterium ST9]